MSWTLRSRRRATRESGSSGCTSAVDIGSALQSGQGGGAAPVGVATQLSCHDPLLDLARAATDGEQPRVPVEPLHLVLADVAVAAVDLQRLAHRRVGQPTADELADRGIQD